MISNDAGYDFSHLKLMLVLSLASYPRDRIYLYPRECSVCTWEYIFYCFGWDILCISLLNPWFIVFKAVLFYDFPSEWSIHCCKLHIKVPIIIVLVFLLVGLVYLLYIFKYTYVDCIYIYKYYILFWIELFMIMYHPSIGRCSLCLKILSDIRIAIQLTFGFYFLQYGLPSWLSW